MRETGLGGREVPCGLIRGGAANIVTQTILGGKRKNVKTIMVQIDWGEVLPPRFRRSRENSLLVRGGKNIGGGGHKTNNRN